MDKKKEHEINKGISLYHQSIDITLHPLLYCSVHIAIMHRIRDYSNPTHTYFTVHPANPINYHLATITTNYAERHRDNLFILRCYQPTTIETTRSNLPTIKPSWDEACIIESELIIHVSALGKSSHETEYASYNKIDISKQEKVCASSNHNQGDEREKENNQSIIQCTLFSTLATLIHLYINQSTNQWSYLLSSYSNYLCSTTESTNLLFGPFSELRC